MFGFSFSELVVVVIVALVVMGPKDLPKMLRRVGQWAGKIRRAAADLRASSGIDDALRSEGLADDIAEIRKLARGELDTVQRMARVDDNSSSGAATARKPAPQNYDRGDDIYIVRDREYPREGADCYNAIPDNAIFYSEAAPKSPLARDPLYVLGDADGVLPPEPEPEPEPPAAPPEPETLGVPPASPTLRGIGTDELDATPVQPTVIEPDASGASATIIGGVGITVGKDGIAVRKDGADAAPEKDAPLSDERQHEEARS